MDLTELTVRELQEYLNDFNPDAKVKVIVENYPREFSFAWGSSEGCTKKTCESFSFYIDGNDEAVDEESEKDIVL